LDDDDFTFGCPVLIEGFNIVAMDGHNEGILMVDYLVIIGGIGFIVFILVMGFLAWKDTRG